jgi:hypothetical protein
MTTPKMTAQKTHYYASTNGDHYDIGPCATKEQAYERAIDEMHPSDAREDILVFVGLMTQEESQDLPRNVAIEEVRMDGMTGYIYVDGVMVN